MPKITKLFDLDPLEEIVKRLEPYRDQQINFICIAPLAQLLGCTRQTVYRYQRQGYLKLSKIGETPGITVPDLLKALKELIPRKRPDRTREALKRKRVA